MGSERYKLSTALSFRRVATLFALVDHSTGSIHLLNESAGEILERLERGEVAFDEEEESFIEDLVALRMVVPSEAGERIPEDDAGPSSDEPDGDLLDELNDIAADALVPVHCQMELTYACGLSCEHCYLRGYDTKNEAELSTGEIISALDGLRNLGCLFLLLTGGEPLLRADFEEIFVEARRRRFAVSVCTGAGVEIPGLPGRMARMGVDGVQVSLYGADALVHDGMTGSTGSFERALRFMRECRDEGVRVRAAVTVTKRNVHQLEAMRDLLDRERLGAALGVYMSPTRSGDPAPQELTVDEAGLHRTLSVFTPAAQPRLKGRPLDSRPCGCGANTLSIDPFGAVYPCLTMRTRVGSIRHEDIGRIWRHSKELSRIRSVKLADLVDCFDCSMRDGCNRCGGFALLEGKSFLDHCEFDCAQAKWYSEVDNREPK